jgi:hypothetical protein
LSADPVRTLAQCAPDILKKLSPDSVLTLAEYAPAGVAHAGTVDWNPPQTGAGRQPLGLDDAGKALHGMIAARAASTGTHYFAAMAHVTGQPSYAELSDMPTTPVQQQGLDPERQALDKAARVLSISAGISWLDACNYLLEAGGLAELQRDDGSASVPWLDSRQLASPPGLGVRRTGSAISVARLRPESRSARSARTARTPSSSRCGWRAPSRAATSSARWPPSSASRRLPPSSSGARAFSIRLELGRTTGARARSTTSSPGARATASPETAAPPRAGYQARASSRRSHSVTHQAASRPAAHLGAGGDASE